MRPAARRVLTILPPLVVLGGILALVLPSSVADGARARAEASIRARWDAEAETPLVRQDLAAYLDRHGRTLDARWFAIEAYARIGDVAAAFDTWAHEPELASSRPAMRRFADVVWRALAHVPGKPEQASIYESRSLQARIEAGDPEAEALLRARVLEAEPTDILLWYAPMHRVPSRASEVLAKALLENRRSPEATAAGAAIASRPSDRSHVGFLADHLASEWGVERPFMWQHMARALGTAGGPAAIEALRKVRKANEGATPGESMRRQGLDVGLALAGDAEARGRVFASFGRAGPEMAGVQMALGLRTLALDGDATAARQMAELWERAPGPTTRLQLALSCLTSDPLPPPEVPLDRWADELAAEPSHLFRVLAHVWRFRNHVAGAEADTVKDLDEAVHAQDLTRLGKPDSGDSPSALEVLRAWLRWGR